MTTSLTPSAGTILIGDDEAPVLRVLQRILKRSGYAVLSAVDGQEAVDVFQAHDGTVDLVILDVTMPRLSGVEAATRIRALAPDIKIMVSSGYDAGTATSDAPEGVVDGFLQKPFTPDQLRASIKSILEP